MGKFTITFLLFFLVFLFLKTSSSKSTKGVQRKETNKHESTKTFKRPSHGKGKGIVRCNDRSECPDGYACLLPGFGHANSKSNKRCYECGCMTYSQCYFHHRNMFCNCSGSGFTGEFCETNIDDCIPIPCNNNSTCIDQVNGYICQCSPGYTGDHCENVIDRCNPSPCGDKEDCINVDDGYKCTCGGDDSTNITDLMATSTPTTICSPGYNTSGYDYDLNIQWKIAASAGQTIEVFFWDFDVEKDYDYVFVQDDGLQTCLGILTGEHYQIIMPQTLVSSTNELSVTFQTDEIYSYNGFCFNFSLE
ncbi:fibropellin-1-like isoform X2 [Ruditapes philippinarum]|uniref:fibropellin-1-like isoform X2 n=1 Tax=Ruditapes philippinarum TaxID=129788 RepID=UPI00295AC9D7|nr:fibropellin-1-like isoform X2 [Ruditapes philippinarum]